MAVRKQNVLVNVVNFLSMGQDNDEPVKHFIARLRGQSQVCEFVLPAGHTDYSERMILHQLICGIADPTVQEEMLAHTASQDNVTLDKVRVFIEGKESGKREQGLIAKAAGLNRLSADKAAGVNKLSAYQKFKNQSTIANGDVIEDDTEAQCGWCLRKGHGKKPSELSERRNVPLLESFARNVADQIISKQLAELRINLSRLSE